MNLDKKDYDFITKLSRKKEFAQYANLNKIHPEITFSEIIETEMESYHLELQHVQSLIKKVMNPFSPINRIVIKWDPGMGKTICACAAAAQYTRLFKMREEIGTIFIIGFTKEIFVETLLKFPYFGFISEYEVKKRKELEKKKGNSVFDMQKYVDYSALLKRKLTHPKFGGIFKFIGYKQLSTSIFSSESNVNDMSEEEIRIGLTSGSVKWNRALIDSMKNSFVICDEFHRMYNTLEKNNWGVAMQSILDYHKENIKAMFLSATPLNNSPDEITSVLNFINLPSSRIVKSDLFDKKTGRIRNDGYEKINTLSFGKVSYIHDTNEHYYATEEYIGEKIRGIQYLKFIKCPMSKYQETFYNRQIDTKSDDNISRYISDFVLPHPSNPQKTLNSLAEVKRFLGNTDDSFLFYRNKKIGGEILQYNNLKKYYPKMTVMLDLLDKFMSDPTSGKILIYHDYVVMSGILFIESVLNAHGYISLNSRPDDSTKCSICGVRQGTHKKSIPKKIKGGGNRLYKLCDYVQVKLLTPDNLRIVNKILMSSCYATETCEKPDSDIFAIYVRGRIAGMVEYCNTYNHFTYFEVPNNVDIVGEVLRILLTIYRNESITINIHRNTQEWLASILTIYGFESICVDDTWRYMEAEAGSYFRKMVEGGSNDDGSANKNDHEFMPARYSIAHAEISKSVITSELNYLNQEHNIWGYNCRIWIGSRLIKESYNTKEFQKQITLSLPQNISTLIQINGRTRRSRGHMRLPKKYRHIERYIIVMTHSREDSYELKRWRQKMEDYIEIQKIEKILHQNAIDGSIFSWLNLPEKKQSGQMIEPLPYKPNPKISSSVSMSCNNIDSISHNAYHVEEVIQNIVIIIKKLFTGISQCFTSKDLINNIRNPPFSVPFNTRWISDLHLKIAINYLLGNEVEGMNNIFDNTRLTVNNVYNYIYNYIDKRVMMLNGNIGYIYKVGDYYILVPDGVNIEPEVIYRIHRPTSKMSVNITKYLQYSEKEKSYDDIKSNIFEKYHDKSMFIISQNASYFGSSFHNMFIEEVISYVFNIWVFPKATRKSEIHDFLIKMLYYYNMIGLIVWAGTIKKERFWKYSDYVLPIDEKKREEYTNLSSISSSGSTNESKKMSSNISKYKEIARLTLSHIKKFGKTTKNKGEIIKVDAFNLPVGHFYNRVPRFYNPKTETWNDDSNYVYSSQKLIENDIIIGVHEKSKSGLSIKFKVRKPANEVKGSHDARLIETGMVCSSIQKVELMKLVEKLKIKLPKKTPTVVSICKLIEDELIRREIDARKNKTKIKWIYLFWENSIVSKTSTSGQSSATLNSSN
jgi:hypothetical protein